MPFRPARTLGVGDSEETDADDDGVSFAEAELAAVCFAVVMTTSSEGDSLATLEGVWGGVMLSMLLVALAIGGGMVWTLRPCTWTLA